MSYDIYTLDQRRNTLECLNIWEFWTSLLLIQKLIINIRTIKSFTSNLKEYGFEYRDFDLEMIKSLYLNKDFQQSDDKETLNIK